MTWSLERHSRNAVSHRLQQQNQPLSAWQLFNGVAHVPLTQLPAVQQISHACTQPKPGAGSCSTTPCTSNLSQPSQKTTAPQHTLQQSACRHRSCMTLCNSNTDADACKTDPTGAGDNGLAIGRGGQVENAHGVASERGQLSHAGVPPHYDLVLAVAVRAHYLIHILAPRQIAYLTPCAHAQTSVSKYSLLGDVHHCTKHARHVLQEQAAG